MSVIYPRTYRLISEQLGEAYGKVRDAIWQDGATYTASALENSLEVADLQAANADDLYDGSNPPDDISDMNPSDADYSDWIASTDFTAPKGSVAKDLGVPVFTFTNTTVTLTNAKSVASKLFAPYLRSLNSHVVNRTHGISTIGGYYDTYAFIADTSTSSDYQDKLNLFDDDPLVTGLGISPSYFTADFVELSAQIGIAIDAEYQA